MRPKIDPVMSTEICQSLLVYHWHSSRLIIVPELQTILNFFLFANIQSNIVPILALMIRFLIRRNCPEFCVNNVSLTAQVTNQ